jgi:hypothetical protein
MRAMKGKTPGGNPFFQWMEESIGFPCMVRGSSGKMEDKLNLIFSAPKNPIFFAIDGKFNFFNFLKNFTLAE